MNKVSILQKSAAKPLVNTNPSSMLFSWGAFKYFTKANGELKSEEISLRSISKKYALKSRKDLITSS
jgi:hypothetical protein